MPLTYSFTCPLPNGVHARPASALEDVARPFAADVSLVNERTGASANAKSVLAIVGIDVRLGDRCLLRVAGPDERKALDRLATFLAQDFPHCDDNLPGVESRPGEIAVPPLLARAHVRIHAGTPVVRGIGVGAAVRLGGFTLPSSIPLDGIDDREAEAARVRLAIDSLIGRYDLLLGRSRSRVERDVLEAHRSVARDPEFADAIEREVRDSGRTAAGAVAHAQQHFTAVLAATGSALLRERALDVRDVCRQLLRELYGTAIPSADVSLTRDCVCIADSVTPAQFLALDRRHLKGLVLAQGGTTSHTVILARSFGIPTVVGVSDVTQLRVDEQEVVADGDLGALVTDLDEPARRYYDMERQRLEGRERRLRRSSTEPAATADGRRIEIAANIGTAAEAGRAFATGAEGIGLFRTEVLFLDRGEPPGEDEQFEEYRGALEAARGKPVIIRTLDVGGDKPIPYLRLPSEDNPFLGYRAVRLYPEFEAIFRTQVRALVRASTFGRLKVMVPMLSRAEEARWVNGIIADEQASLARDGVALDKAMPVGAMVEVPSLAFLLDRLSGELDFFSIGSNDLLQYFTAVDRSNRKIASLYNPLEPAFLQLLAKIVGDAHARNRWVGLCGEIGGDRRLLPLLVGLGLDEISMAAPAIAAAKADLRSLSSSSCSALLERAVACADAASVDHVLQEFDRSRPTPLIDAALIDLQVCAASKEEAIKAAVDRLYVDGRTDRPREVEAAVWRRESVYSTGFGHGFAIPHCKTDAVRGNSLALLRLAAPIEWGSLDEKPVGLLILLVIRESDQATAHMKVLAALARKMMHDEFREVLLREEDPQKLASFLRESVGA